MSMLLAREPHPITDVETAMENELAGEALVRQTLREHYIVRTAWVNGARGSNFVSVDLPPPDSPTSATIVPA